MAVFTEVSFSEAAALLARLQAGELTRLTGIAGGIENTNYFAETSERQCVITVFERLNRQELPFYLKLMKHLASRQLPVPDPLADAAGEILHTLAGKPAAVVERLPGTAQLAPTREHCEAVARTLAGMHVAGRDFPGSQPNPRGLAWWLQTAAAVSPLVTPEQRALLVSELEFQQRTAATPEHAALPRGPIHADLFRDNVLFEGARLSGVLDFYFAGVDAWSFDIAVCLNDWCSDHQTGRLLEPQAAAFVSAYAEVRALTEDERQLMPVQLRAAALRFWLSRLYDLHVPRTAALLEAHDPAVFEHVLRERIDRPWTPAEV